MAFCRGRRGAGLAGFSFVRLAIVFALTSGLFAAGCVETRLDRVLKTPDQFQTLDHRSAYLKAHMKDGRLYVLSKWQVGDAGRQVSGVGELFGLARETMGSGSFTVALDEVALLETNVLQRSASAAALAVITGISVAVTMFCIENPKACFGSCPTFYVSDGTEAVLQAEGFSSSVAPSLEARDIDALYRVQPVRREFIVTMKNEALETHVVRGVRLLAAKRPTGGRVIATLAGEFREASDLRAVEACRADEGDCSAKVRAFDGDERFSAADAKDLARREVIEMQLPASDGPRGLVIASRQTLASTYLFYQSLAWLGRSASATLAALERGDRMVGGALTRLRDTVGGIEVLAETGGGDWVSLGEVREMGPLAADVVIVPLPVGATGRVRLSLARGHWRIDYVASARLGARVEPFSIESGSVASARKLQPAQGPLVTLPGDVHTYSFLLPDDPRRYEFFLETRGYYLEWMRDEWLPDENPARAAQLMSNPAQLLRDVAPEFKKQEARMEAVFWGSRYARR
jgi:hypothetical protein